MKATVKLLSIVGMTLLCLQACKSNMESASESVDSNMEESAYSSNQNSMKVGAESKGLNAKFSAEKRKFMRTANLKFKVEDRAVVVNLQPSLQIRYPLSKMFINTFRCLINE